MWNGAVNGRNFKNIFCVYEMKLFRLPPWPRWDDPRLPEADGAHGQEQAHHGEQEEQAKKECCKKIEQQLFHSAKPRLHLSRRISRGERSEVGRNIFRALENFAAGGGNELFKRFVVAKITKVKVRLWPTNLVSIWNFEFSFSPRQRMFVYFVRGSITVQLTSCFAFFGFDQTGKSVANSTCAKQSDTSSCESKFVVLSPQGFFAINPYYLI